MKKIILLLSTFLLFSCGARKVNKINEKETIEKEKTINIVDNENKTIDKTENTTTKLDVIIDKSSNEITEVETIEADDKSKPAFYNGINLNNTKVTKSKTNVLSNEKKIDNTIIENKIKILETENKQYFETILELEKAIKSKNEKNTIKKEPYIAYIVISFLILLLIYIVWKKYIENKLS